MKHIVPALGAVLAGLLLFGCADESVIAPTKMQSDQVPVSLAKRPVTYFEGTSTTFNMVDAGKTTISQNGVTHIRGLVVQTREEMDDDRVCGVVTWVVHMDIYENGEDSRWGTGELVVPERGSWQLPYKGWARVNPDDGEMYVTYEVDGHGKGEFQGIKGHWTYYKQAVPGVPFAVTGFLYEGN